MATPQPTAGHSTIASTAAVIHWSLVMLATAFALVGAGLAVGAGALLAGVELSAGGVSLTLTRIRIAVVLAALAGGFALGAVGLTLTLS